MNISRHIINKDIDYDGYNYNQLCNLIDRWKYLLVSKNVKKGNTLALSISIVNPNQIALTIAAAELGLQLFIIDWPISIKTMSKTKLGLFGPVDFTVECESLRSIEIHHKMITEYSLNVIAENEIDSIHDTYTPIWGRASSPFLIASTSGTTGEAKPIIFTQKEIYEMSKRNIDIFKFYKDSRVGHTKNMHHASSLITDLIPSLMASDFHRSCLYSVLDPKTFENNVIPIVKKYKLDRLLVYNMFSMFKFLEALGEDNDYKIVINMSGFSAPKNFPDICRKFNIEIVSHYGSIDTGIPLLVNYITEHSKYIPNSLGILPDKFYKMEKQMLITKDLINKDIDYDGYNYEKLCSLIDRWKSLFKKYGAKRGDSMAASLPDASINQVALHFAAGELGLQMLIIDFPVSPATIHKTKMGMFGPVDFTVDSPDMKQITVHRNMVEKYSKRVIELEEIDSWFEEYSAIEAEPEDPYLICSTSGTTGDARKILMSQREVFLTAKRNIGMFRFKKEHRCGHTKNMHHASSFLTDLLPSLIVSDFHRSCMYTALDPNSFVNSVVPAIEKEKLDRILVYNTYSMYRLLDALGKRGPDTQKIIVNISGFTAPETFIQVCEDYNIEILSHYGSVDIGSLLVNYITKDSVYTPDSLGNLPDDFHTFEVIDGDIYVSNEILWNSNEKRKLQDNLVYDEENKVWLHKGRKDRNPLEDEVRKMYSGDFTIVQDKDKRYLALWDDTEIPEQFKIMFDQIERLDKEVFMPETKVSVDQLRGHFQYHKEKNQEIFSVSLKFKRINEQGEHPWNIIDQEQLFGLLRGAYNKYDIDHIPLIEEHDPIFAAFTIASCNKESLKDFFDNEGAVIYSMEKILEEKLFSPKIVYNEIHAVS